MPDTDRRLDNQKDIELVVIDDDKQPNDELEASD